MPLVGFIGLGNMGYPMASNLSLAVARNCLPPLVVWTRNQDTLKKFGDSHIATCVSSLDDLASRCTLIFTSLANDSAASSVYKAILPSLQRDTVLVDFSTLYPTFVRELGEKVKAVGAHFLSCPVFGPPNLAQKKELILVMSGEKELKRQIGLLLVPGVARKIIDVGDDVGAGASMKLVGNSMILGVIELLAESLTLADRTGVGAENAYEFVKEFLPTPSFIGYGQKIVNDNYAPGGFSIPGGLKDASHILALAAEHNTPLPIVTAAHSHLLTARALTGPEAAETDWSFLVAGVRAGAGVNAFKRDFQSREDEKKKTDDN